MTEHVDPETGEVIDDDPILQALQDEMDLLPVYAEYEDDDPRAADYALVERYLGMRNRLDAMEAKVRYELDTFRAAVEAKLNADLAGIRGQRESLRYHFERGVMDATARLLDGAKRKSVVTTQGTVGFRSRAKDGIEYDRAEKARIIDLCRLVAPDVLVEKERVTRTVDLDAEKTVALLQSDPMTDLHGCITVHPKGEQTFYAKAPNITERPDSGPREDDADDC